MAVLLLFITLLVGVSCRNVPSNDYIPTRDQLDLIFGISATKSPSLGSPAAVSDPNLLSWTFPAADEEANSKTIDKSPEKVDVNKRTNANDSEKQKVMSDKLDKKVNSTVDGDKLKSGDAPKGNWDDRMALGAVVCVGGVRAGNKCIKGV
ncbi:hypothetical protein B5X24_HaOG203209 [Helicoverpa armigera]|uniref:Uncharacterized protein n=1 Tax=Helicoverpa armigera TaxID=29058 RepID=A0A2W1BY22_HELAM|nr:hypothetical protein B5X24_HaOG203209 [Helicoverpa armigera]